MKPEPVSPTRVARVRRTLDEQSGEMPSSDGGGGKGGHSDRTGSLAFRQRIDPEDDKRGHLADVARAASENIDALMYQIMTNARLGRPVGRLVAMLDRALDKWEPLNTWAVRNLQSETVDKGSDGCVSCATVPDSLGRALYSIPHPGLKVCQRCWSLLKRVRAYDGHNLDDVVPAVVLLWRERHGDPRVTEAVLDRLLSAKVKP